MQESWVRSETARSTLELLCYGITLESVVPWSILLSNRNALWQEETAGFLESVLFELVILMIFVLVCGMEGAFRVHFHS